jgi:phosphate transport system substrate-binding protein
MDKKYKIQNILILFLLFILINGCQKQKAGITLAGSNSITPFAELLAEEYMLINPQSRIHVQDGGSTAGIVAIRNNAAHIGMCSRPLSPTERDLHSVIIAKDAIAIIVHPKNPVEDLSISQIRLIFSGKIRNWREVGGLSNPIVVITREEGSGTRDSFQKMVMGKDEITLEALVQDASGTIRQLVADDPNAIGYISLGLVNEKVKPLKIAGVEPTFKNIENGKYTLVRPFLFVFKCEPEGEVKTFLDFVLSKRGQQLLAKEGLVPVIQE